MTDYSYPTIFQIFQQDQVERVDELIDQNGIVSILGVSSYEACATLIRRRNHSRR